MFATSWKNLKSSQIKVVLAWNQLFSASLVRLSKVILMFEDLSEDWPQDIANHVEYITEYNVICN